MAATDAERTNAAEPTRRAGVLVDADELEALIDGAAPLVVLAVRAPDAAPDRPWHATARIPGSLDADLATDLADAGGGLAGSRPLPPLERLQEAARRWGVRATGEVVVYDHDGGLQAARAWWVLRWAGLTRVRLLDGGFAAWQAAGRPVVHEAARPARGDVTLTRGNMPELDADGAQRLAREGVLLDSRIAANYAGGATAPSEPARGHIPGARSVPAASNLDVDGRFLVDDRLRALYAAAGVDGSRPVAVYCGAGVSAAHDVLALASIGIDAPMYVGSWSAWSADPARPVARGDVPG